MEGRPDKESVAIDVRAIPWPQEPWRRQLLYEQCVPMPLRPFDVRDYSGHPVPAQTADVPTTGVKLLLRRPPSPPGRPGRGTPSHQAVGRGLLPARFMHRLLVPAPALGPKQVQSLLQVKLAALGASLKPVLADARFGLVPRLEEL